VVSKGRLDVVVMLDYCRAQVFVTLDHQKVLLVSEIVKRPLLMKEQVARTLLWLHKFFTASLNECSKPSKDLRFFGGLSTDDNSWKAMFDGLLK
jgi:hypothetical protein